MIDQRAVYAEIAQRPFIQLFEPLPVTPSPVPDGDKPKQGAKESDAAATPRALRREDGVSQG